MAVPWQEIVFYKVTFTDNAEMLADFGSCVWLYWHLLLTVVSLLRAASAEQVSSYYLKLTAVNRAQSCVCLAVSSTMTAKT